MTHSEIDLRSEFIFKIKMRDADSRRETQIFLFISEISVYQRPN
jgi:hypothetical protein